MKRLITTILIVTYCFNSVRAQEHYTLTYQYKDLLGNNSTANLLVKESEAVFKVIDNRVSEKKILESQEPNTINIATINNDQLSSFTYTDNKKVYIRTLGIMEREFIYQFDTTELDWEFTQETKKISTYQCQKATLNLHGRDYEVWFTTEVPITFGPMRLNGLPGMIVEVTIYYPNEKKNVNINWKLLSVKKNIDEKLFSFHKDFFKTNNVLTYAVYEKKAIQNMVDKKIHQYAKAAAIAAKWAEEDGYESEYVLKYEPAYYFDYFFDIPKGAWEELEKINQ